VLQVKVGVSMHFDEFDKILVGVVLLGICFMLLPQVLRF
jgi:hypothetical protein